MSIMDKLKSAAQDVAAEAKKATAQGKDKLGELQARRRMDDCAKELGYLTYRERVKGVTEGAETERLVTEMKELEASLEESSAPQSTLGDAQPPASEASSSADAGSEPGSGPHSNP